MSSLRPMKDLRSVSVNELTPYSTSKRSIPTPFLRHTSVVEVVEKKQRDGLKERLKMLYTGVLPSRRAVSTNLPVIVKAPVGRVALPKNPPRKAHYQSVLVLTAEPEGEPSRLTRRHSIGGLIGGYRGRERSISESNGNAFKREDFFADRVSLDKYKNVSNDADHHKTDTDTSRRAKFRIAKDDSHLERDNKSSVVTILSVSKSQSQILTNIAADEKVGLKETLKSDAKMNGNLNKGDNDDYVFSLQSTKDDLDENLNIRQISKNHDLKDGTEKKPDIDCLVNGHREATTKTYIENDIIKPTKISSRTSLERDEAHAVFRMAEPRANGDGETHYNVDKEPRPSFSTGIECAMLIDIDDSTSVSPSHNCDVNEESHLEKSQQEKSETAELTTFTELAYPAQTEAMEKEAEIQKVEKPILYEENRNTFDDNAISDIHAMSKNVAHDISDDVKEKKTKDDKSKDESDSFWSTVEDSLTGPFKTTSNSCHSELIEIELRKSPDVGLVKFDLSDNLKEPNKNDDTNKSDALWPDFEEPLTGSSSKFSSESTETVIQKYSDSDLDKHDLSNDLKELTCTKTDNEIDDRPDDGVLSAVENSFVGSEKTTSSKSRGELIEVEIQKCPDAGLGFCIEGGGDLPVTVKRVFNAATNRCLKEGDEILTVSSQDTTTLTRIDAWRLFKSLPDGPVKMKISRRME